MTIEALVKPSFPRIVGTPWMRNGPWGLHSGASVTINTITVAVEQGHRYRVTVTAGGYAHCEGTMLRTYMISAGLDTIASQRVGYDRGGFTGLAAIPIALCGIWTAPAKAQANFNFIMTRDDATNDQDWELGNCVHQMFVEDLGP